MACCCTTNGSVHYSTPNGQMLMHHATGTPLTALTLFDSHFGWAKAALIELVSNLNTLSDGRQALPPALQTRNAYGSFLLRADLLQAGSMGAKNLVCLHIRHLVPQHLRMLTLPEIIDLSPRQREVVQHLVSGKQNAAIATLMGLSPNTVDSMVKDIYACLGTYSRQGLRDMLSREPGGGVGKRVS